MNNFGINTVVPIFAPVSTTMISYLLQKQDTMNLKKDHNGRERELEILTIKEAANLLRVCERKIYYLMEQGLLKHYRIPNTKKRLFKKEEVLGLLQEAA